MSEQRIVVGLDMGSHRISAIVAEIDELGGRRVLGLGTVPSDGISKGVIVSFEPAVTAVRAAVEEAERASGLEIKSVLPGVTGEHFKSIRSDGVHAKEGGRREILPEDMEQVIRVARSLQLPSGYSILHTLPIDFILDNQRGIKAPVGMDGVRLQAEVLLILGQESVLENSGKVVEKAGLRVEGKVFTPLATAMSATEESERQEGVVLVDLGGDTTEILVIHQGTARHTEVLPLGGANVTRDLSIGLNISMEDAERLKLDHATLMPSADGGGNKRFPIRQVGRDEERYVTEQTMRSIIEPRMKELLEQVWKKASLAESARRSSSGVILCGGGAMLPGLQHMAAQIFERTVRLAAPAQQEGLTAELQSPRYTPTVGLLDYAYRTLSREDGIGESGKGGGGNLRRWLRSVGRRR